METLNVDAGHPSVGFLTSLFWPDEVSRKRWKEAIGSLEAQNGVDCYSYIRLVDGTEKDTAAIRRWLAKRTWLAGFDVSRNDEPGEPQPVSWNACYTMAREHVDFCAVLDADNTWAPHGVKMLVDLLTSDVEASLAYGDYEQFRDDDKPGWNKNILLPRVQPIWMVPFCGPFVVWPVALAERLIETTSELYDPKLLRCADHKLWIRFATLGHFVCTKETVGRFLLRSESLFHRDKEASWAERVKVQRFGALLAKEGKLSR